MKLKIFLTFLIAVFAPLFPVSAATLVEMGDGEGNTMRIYFEGSKRRIEMLGV